MPPRRSSTFSCWWAPARSSLSIPLALCIAVLLVTVGVSYHQTILAYPKGGGSYIVARDNLGDVPGLTAASALLIAYILTVAVSIAAGVAALTSWMPALFPYRVLIGVAGVVVITVVNMRGVRESATIFTVPTYLFIGGILSMLAYGLIRWATGTLPVITPDAVHGARRGRDGVEPLFVVASVCGRLHCSDRDRGDRRWRACLSRTVLE